MFCYFLLQQLEFFITFITSHFCYATFLHLRTPFEQESWLRFRWISREVNKKTISTEWIFVGNEMGKEGRFLILATLRFKWKRQVKWMSESITWRRARFRALELKENGDEETKKEVMPTEREWTVIPWRDKTRKEESAFFPVCGSVHSVRKEVK